MSLDLPRPVRVFTPADLEAADPTSGMQRALAFELPLLWAGQVETEPGAVSGWHHHDRNESSLYIVRGVLRLEFEGHDGYLDAGPGDFVHVPAWTVHRESNPHPRTFPGGHRQGGRWDPHRQRRRAGLLVVTQSTSVTLAEQLGWTSQSTLSTA